MGVCCEKCFSDDAIKEFIRLKATTGKCDYCGSGSVRARVATASVKEVAAFIDDGIERKYQDATVVGGTPPGPITFSPAQVLETEDPVFDSRVLTDHTKLLTDLLLFSRYAGMDLVSIGPAHFSPAVFALRWDEFTTYVKHESRYTLFSKFEQYMKVLHDYGPAPEPLPSYRDQRHQHFDELWYSIQQILDKYLYGLPKNGSLFRARLEDPNNAFGHRDLTSAPRDVRRNNRMSPSGINYFYGSEDRNVCIAEIGAGQGQTVVIGEFKMREDLYLVDLSVAYPTPTIYSGDFFPGAWFLKKFCDEISKVVLPGDDEVEYVPTQVLCDYIQHNFWGRKFHGLRYPSSVASGAASIVLFRGPDISLGPDPWLDFTGMITETIP